MLTRDVFEEISNRYTEDRARMEEVIGLKYHPDVIKTIMEQNYEEQQHHPYHPHPHPHHDEDALFNTTKENTSTSSSSATSTSQEFLALQATLHHMMEKIHALETNICRMEATQEVFHEMCRRQLRLTDKHDRPVQDTSLHLHVEVDL
jgi:hypothetical protein